MSLKIHYIHLTLLLCLLMCLQLSEAFGNGTTRPQEWRCSAVVGTLMTTFPNKAIQYLHMLRERVKEKTQNMQTEQFRQKGDLRLKPSTKIYILRAEEPPRGLEAFCKGANGFRVFTPPLGCSFLQDSCFTCQVHHAIKLE